MNFQNDLPGRVEGSTSGKNNWQCTAFKEKKKGRFYTLALGEGGK